MNQIVTHLANQIIAPTILDDAKNLLGRIGNLDVRLAQSEEEIAAAQRIRFTVFHDEFGAQMSREAVSTRRDCDAFDAHCDHLVVLDRDIPGNDAAQIVGTYRLMRKTHAAQTGGYYSASEFAIAGLVTRHANRSFLELGRSCVLPSYRSKRTVELLWQGIWAYTQMHHIDVMMGCASFQGTIPAQHAQALTFLHKHARAKGAWHVTPLAGRHVSMDLMPEEAINLKSAIAAMPPLIKGYLRLGALFGDGAVIDHAFNTTDVMVVLPIENISARYRAHYGENADRFAA